MCGFTKQDPRLNQAARLREWAETLEKEVEAENNVLPVKNIVDLLALWQNGKVADSTLINELLYGYEGFEMWDGADAPHIPGTGGRITDFTPAQVIKYLWDHHNKPAKKEVLQLFVHAYLRRIAFQNGVELTRNAERLRATLAKKGDEK